MPPRESADDNGLPYSAGQITVSSSQLSGWHGTASPEALSVGGPCPACGHDTRFTIPRQLSDLKARVVRLRPGPLTTLLDCACEEEHPGRPAGKAIGCGRTWFAVAETGADGNVTLSTAPASQQQDPALSAAVHAIHDIGPGQLAEVRRAARSWIGGVSAFYTLLTIAGLTITRTRLTEVATFWQVLVALAAVVSVSLAALAVYRIYEAAYGWPTAADVSDDQKIRAWWQRQQLAPFAVAQRLKDGVRAAAGSVGAVLVTTGLLWFAPASAAAPLVRATLTSGAVACGTLLPASAPTSPAGLLIQLASNGSVVIVPMPELASVSPVRSC